MNIIFKIQIQNTSKPPVWRKFSIPASFTFEELHIAIQIAFGWEDYHLFQFCPNGWGSNPVICLPNEENEEVDIDASECTLGEIFTNQYQKFTYIYDFGDDWAHDITVEDTTDLGAETVVLLGGKGKCPPEDCGGPWGYANLTEILEDPKNPEYNDMKDWLGLGLKDKWDKNEFDLKATQKELDECFSER